MASFFRWVLDTISIVVAVSLATISGAFMEPKTVVITPRQPVIFQKAMVPPPELDSLALFATTTLSSSTPQTSTPRIAPPPKPIKIIAEKKEEQIQPTPLLVAPKIITAETLLTSTTIFQKQKVGSVYAVGFNADPGNGKGITWDIGATAIGSSDGVPEFATSFSCDPPPEMPLSGTTDNRPSFQIRTSYTCTVSLTPRDGNDRQTQTKRFAFQTGPGQFFVTLPSSIDPKLKDGQNYGGFVFNNEDSKPVTVTGLTLDASFTALSTSSVPLVVKFIDPRNEATLFEYHLENLPKDPALPDTQSQTGIFVPLSFQIRAREQRLLSMQVLGVQRRGVAGTNPAVKITLQGVTADQSDVKVALRATTISWTCIIPKEAYNPNATSSAYATGQACGA